MAEYMVYAVTVVGGPAVGGRVSSRVFAEPNISPTTPYEADMSIIYDAVGKCVVVSLPGKTVMLGPFADRRSAIVAAEELCRAEGWGQ